jgi:hypothetical protein
VTHAGLCFLLVVLNALAIYVNSSLVASSLNPVSFLHHFTLRYPSYSPLQISQTILLSVASKLSPHEAPPKMCYQVVERYSVCRCLYYKHAIDPCPAHGQRGHTVQEKTVLVGYACSSHGSHRPQYVYNAGVLPDSGYESGTFSPASLR